VLSKPSIKENETLEASITITNTGSYAGTEIVQLYIHDPVASVARPVKELKGFEKVELMPNESKTVAFTIGFDELAFYLEDMSIGVEAGQFNVMIGTNSRDTQTASFKLE